MASLQEIMFYLRKRGIGISKAWVSELFTEIDKKENSVKLVKGTYKERVEHELENLYKLKKSISKAKSQDEAVKIIAQSPTGPKLASSSVFIIDAKFGIPASVGLNNTTMQRIAESDIKKDDVEATIFKYRDQLYNYVNNNTKLKNRVMRGGESYNDLTQDISREDFDALLKRALTSEKTLNIESVFKKLVVDFLTVYNTESLRNNPELIDYEMRSGDFDKHVKDLKDGKPLSEQEIIEEHEKFKGVEPEDKHLLTDVELLKTRCETLPEQEKNEILNMIAEAESSGSIEEKIDRLSDAFLSYEAYNRSNIVNSLGQVKKSKDGSPEIFDSYEKCPTVMIHTFIKNRQDGLQRLQEGVIEQEKQKIIDERLSGDKDPELTDEEYEKFQERKDYVENVLFNQAVVDQVADITPVYTDANGFTSYKSNTQNQISAGVFNKDSIVDIGSSMGIGFDAAGVDPENIAMISSSYKTTNKGLENIEITDDSTDFKSLSASFADLENSKQNEVVLFRNGIESNTKPSYVYVSLSGHKDDEQLLEDAIIFAKSNNLPLRVFEIDKIIESKKDFMNQKSEPQVESVDQASIDAVKQDNPNEFADTGIVIEKSEQETKKQKKLKYTPVKDYDRKKQDILKDVERMVGKIPEGYDDDRFMTSVIKIIEHLETNYETSIKREDIPDIDKFPEQGKEQYSIREFVLNRLLKNVESVKFLDKHPEGKIDTSGAYMYSPNPNGKGRVGIGKIEIYLENERNNQKKAKTPNNLRQFETEKDFDKMMEERNLIHEIIHAISDNEVSVGFAKNEIVGKNLNEGMTDNLASEIAGLRDFSATVFTKGEDTSAIRTQTISGYRLQENIINLVRVASEEDMTIPYLVNPEKIKYGFMNKIDIYNTTGKPIDKISAMLDEAVSKYNEVHEIKNPNYDSSNPQSNETIAAKSKNVGPFQELQDMIVTDIFKNKYNGKFLQSIRDSGQAPSKGAYESFYHDMAVIGRCIVPTFDTSEGALTIEDKQDFASNATFESSADIDKLIESGKIQQTDNVSNFRNMLFAMENVRKDFAQELGDEE